jgi:hypothetical protein
MFVEAAKRVKLSDYQAYLTCFPHAFMLLACHG